MPTTNETVWLWIAPQRLGERWQPEMFRPEFLELDRRLARSSDFVRLGELVQIVRQGVDDRRTKWHVDLSGVTRRAAARDSDTAATLPVTPLPNEALLVSRTWHHSPVVRYWDSHLYHGNATASWGFFALRSRTAESIAWLQRELESKHGNLQLIRWATGANSNHLAAEDLLNIQVRNLPPQEREAAGRDVRDEAGREAASLRPKGLSKGFLLTGRTFETRLQQFEEYLTKNDLFPSGDAFVAEPATRSPESDLFTVRPLVTSSHSTDSALSPVSLLPQLSLAANESWRSWFWSGCEDEHHRVFNSFLLDDELPAYLMRHMVAGVPPAVSSISPKVLPAFSTFRDAIFPGLKANAGNEEQVWADVWNSLQESCEPQVRGGKGGNVEDTERNRFEFEQELYAWSRKIYRPILAIKVRRSGVVVSAYLLIGDDQIREWNSSYAKLDDLGIFLGDILHPPRDLMDDVTRFESLRRLSAVMHQIKGPVGLAISALADVKDFLDRTPDISGQLVPDEVRAKRRARMPGGVGLERQTLGARIIDAQKAVSNIKKIAYQLIRLRKVQEDLEKNWFRLDQLLAACCKTCLEGRPDITIDDSALTPVEVCANADSISYAVDEVLRNSCRELSEHSVDVPTIRVSCGMDGAEAWLQVSDNGLPEQQSLIPDPFDEGVTGYGRSGRGTGYGLAIVRGTFKSHGGDCSLTENYDDDSRVPGVTFYAHVRTPSRGESAT